MLDLTLKEIAQMAGGQLNKPEYEDIHVDVVSIDTRTISAGEMYMPILGEKLDGHIFIDMAFEKDAIASFCNIKRQKDFDDYPLVLVEDTNAAFTKLAKNFRQKVEPIKVIGITGSNGKTTTKDLINLALQSDFKVAKTIGNLNNEIGVPRTLLRLDKSTDVGIVEMGTDGFGQIAHLTDIVRPDIAILTNIGDSHLHVLKTKENVAKEKVDIIKGLDQDGVFIYNYDDPYLRKEVTDRQIAQRIITFGQDEDSDYVITIVKMTNSGSTFKLNGQIYRTSLLGSHNIYNAAVAIIVSQLFHVDQGLVKRQLEISQSSAMRTELLNLDGFDLLNDSYKSNPQSLKSALDTLDNLSGYKRKIAILGDMLELGDDEEELHRMIGRYIDPNKIDYLLLTGPLSTFIAEEASKNFPLGHVFHIDKKEDLIDKAKYLIQKNSLVLVKASRSLRLEEIVEALELITL